MRVVNAGETERALPFATLISALCEMFVGECVVPPRHHRRIELDPEPNAKCFGPREDAKYNITKVLEKCCSSSR